MKLDVKAFAMTAGLLWGAGLFLMTWWLIAWEGSTGDATLLGRFYFGYRISPVGSVIGLLWAIPDGALGGAIFAWIYNQFAKRTSAATR